MRVICTEFSIRMMIFCENNVDRKYSVETKFQHFRRGDSGKKNSYRRLVKYEKNVCAYYSYRTFSAENRQTKNISF